MLKVDEDIKTQTEETGSLKKKCWRSSGIFTIRRIDQLNVILSIFNEAAVKALGAQFLTGGQTVG